MPGMLVLRRMVSTPALARPAGMSALTARHEMLRAALPSPASRAVALRALSTESGGATSESDEKPKPEGEAEATAADDGASAAADGAATDAAADDGAATVESLQAKVEELEAQVASKHEQVLRALAEAENARRRATIDVENAHKFAVGKFAKSLLDVADNLSRAAESVPEEMRTSDEQPVLRGLYEGVVMTETTLVKAFEENGMKKRCRWARSSTRTRQRPLRDARSGEGAWDGRTRRLGRYVLHHRWRRAAGVGIVSKPA